MPTAVEFLTKLLSRALSLEVVEGTATQKLFATLDTEIDSGVAALENATTPAAFRAAEHEYGHVFRKFGSDAAHFDREFTRDAAVFSLFDRHSDVSSATQADLVAFDKQFAATGRNLGALGVDLTQIGSLHSQEGLAGAVGNLATQSTTLEGDFGALSAATTTLADDLATGKAATPYVAAATALQPMATNFSALAADFGNFAALCNGTATSGLTFDGVFASLDKDFISLDNSLHGMASPMAQIILAPHSASLHL